MVEIKRRYRQLIEGNELTIGDDHRAGLWLFTPTAKAIAVNGSTETGEPVLGFDHSTLPRTLLHLPLPLRRHPPTSIKFEGKDVLIQWPSVPERPPTKHTPQNDEEARAHELFLRARSVWDRLRDVDSALGDPAVLWQELRRRWTSDDYAEPQMDVIVRHAINLRRTIDELDRAPPKERAARLVAPPPVISRTGTRARRQQRERSIEPPLHDDINLFVREGPYH